MAEITTTLNKIRDKSPCEDGYKKLMAHLGKTKPDDVTIKFSEITKSNGIQDALWCLRTLDDEHLPLILSFVTDCAESVLHIWEEWAKVNALSHLNAPREAIEAARSGDKKKAANAANAANAAADAARAAAYAARAAAYAAYAAYAAARAAAYAAARAAAYAAYAAAYAAYAAYTARAADTTDAAYTAEEKTQLKLLKKYFS